MAIHTKIICTLGPSVNSLEKILELIQVGMNVARLLILTKEYNIKL
jgi:pyruvate kinase